MFIQIFGIRRMIEVLKKVNGDLYLNTEGVSTEILTSARAGGLVYTS